MPDLQFAPPRPRSTLPAILIAMVVLAAVAWAVFHLNPTHVADMKVTHLETFVPHTAIGSLQAQRSGNMRVLGEATQAVGEDDLYVIADISITDRLRLPIYLEGAVAHLTLASGEPLDPRIVFGNDLKRLEGLFPALTGKVHDPLALDDQVDPGQTRTGSVVLLLPGLKADAWTQKKAASLTINLRNQGPQTVKLP